MNYMKNMITFGGTESTEERPRPEAIASAYRDVLDTFARTVSGIKTVVDADPAEISPQQKVAMVRKIVSTNLVNAKKNGFARSQEMPEPGLFGQKSPKSSVEFPESVQNLTDALNYVSGELDKVEFENAYYKEQMDFVTDSLNEIVEAEPTTEADFAKLIDLLQELDNWRDDYARADPATTG